MTDSKTPEWAVMADGILGDYLDLSEPRHQQLSKLISQALLSAYERGRAEREWQPIETAPKDGTRVLLHTDEGDILSLMWGSYFPPGFTPRQGTEQSGWVMWPGYVGVDLSEVEAIAWMPLPAPPAKENDNER